VPWPECTPIGDSHHHTTGTLTRIHRDGAATPWRESNGQRRLTRMGMHQAMMEEVIHLGNNEREELSWSESNLLARGVVALEELFGLYRDVHARRGSPPGTYEVTSLMRA